MTNLLFHVYYGTRGNAGAYIHDLQTELMQLSIPSHAFVSSLYSFPTLNCHKIFFPFTDSVHSRSFFIKGLRAVELIYGYSYVFLLALLRRPRISLSLNDDTYITLLFFVVCRLCLLRIDVVCHDVNPHDKKIPTSRLFILKNSTRLVVHSHHAAGILKSILGPKCPPIACYPFPSSNLVIGNILPSDVQLECLHVRKLVGTKPFFLLLGVVRNSKGIADILQSWNGSNLSKKYSLVIAGKWSAPALGSLAAASSAQGVLIFNEYLSDAMFSAFIAESYASVLPYHNYTHSAILFNCIDLRSLVLLSDIPFFLECMGSDYRLFHRSGDIASLRHLLGKTALLTLEQRETILNSAATSLQLYRSNYKNLLNHYYAI